MNLLTIAHVDLKGLQQRPQLLLERLEVFARYGYRAVLVEYEDVFPYRSECFSSLADETWSPKFLREFLAKARACGLEVIPLQQTLGHLEYALRWDVLAAFRMPGSYPSTLHLGSPEAKTWLFGLLQEMIDSHPDSSHIHLGMDEARALHAYSKSVGCDPLVLFLDYLDELCRFCEERGKTPVIWSDMLEDHLRPDNLSRIREFRDRVILACWDYAASTKPDPVVRFAGRRVSRYWLEHPEEEGSPRLRSNAEWIEDWPEEIRELAAPHRVSESGFRSLFPAAVWKKLGFRVWGAGAASPSEDGLLIPFYHKRISNLERWQEAAREWRLDGLVVTAWARSQTCSPPGILPELQMPMFLYALQNRCGEEDGDPGELRDLFLRLGRCRENWWIEPDLIAELEARLLSVGSSRPTWELLIRMLRIQAARREIDLATYQGERYLCGDRLPATEWDRRLEELQTACGKLAKLRDETRSCLEKRYFGEALEEWLAEVFDAYLDAADTLADKIILKRKRVAVRFSSRLRVGMCGLFLLAALCFAKAGETGPKETPLLFGEVCVREGKDQAWTVRIRGEVPSLAGCYVLVHDSEGKLVMKKHVPHGNYSDDKALDLTIPKDGRAEDYRIIVVGQEADIRGLNLPLTDLQLEVYGRTLFAIRPPASLWFLAEPGGQKFSGHSGEVRVLDGTTPTAGPLEPGKLYRLDTGKTFYFRADPGVYLNFSPDRCFLPEAKLGKIAWWQLTGSGRLDSPTSAGERPASKKDSKESDG